ncbi:prolipoprotein diacylglyceryl transferase [Haploplasma modicum]|uniref:prolipoprotein diacylglyceryl transferase n=1 Tax=Haploplasma modicum TaxID=2150 RepID=UPI00214C423A|nr:prolipoprotein diacylglyceryl transferase [Haploplasma modicum]MCR1809120.1 prolipoprotein diacylglyceryl transferase [Haploplasma modicum]
MFDKIKKHKIDLILYVGFIAILILLIILAVAFQYGNAKLNVIPYENTAFKIFGAEVQWYALFIMFGILAATFVASVEVKRFGWKSDDLLDGVLIIAPLAIIGARLYYVLFDPAGSPDSFMDVIAIWEGGLAIHGAIIVSTIGIIIYSRIKQINVLLVADILAIGLLIGQISGRWGNFMNAEAHGAAVDIGGLNSILPNFIKFQMRFSSYGPTLDVGQIYQPTFLYESLWNFVGLTILLVVRRIKLLKAGDMIGIYLIWYGLGRGILIEPFRTDQLKEIFGVPVNILLSLVLLVGGGIVFLILKRVFIKDTKYYTEYLLNDIRLPWEKDYDKSDII